MKKMRLQQKRTVDMTFLMIQRSTQQLRLVVYPTVWLQAFRHPRWCSISSLNSVLGFWTIGCPQRVEILDQQVEFQAPIGSYRLVPSQIQLSFKFLFDVIICSPRILCPHRFWGGPGCDSRNACVTWVRAGVWGVSEAFMEGLRQVLESCWEILEGAGGIWTWKAPDVFGKFLRICVVFWRFKGFGKSLGACFCKVFSASWKILEVNTGDQWVPESV